jgi:hypothetical protein
MRNDVQILLTSKDLLVITEQAPPIKLGVPLLHLQASPHSLPPPNFSLCRKWLGPQC